jgi:two-component system chemotaxis response regulator CheY
MGKRVLIVDDIFYMRKILRGFLEENDYIIAGEADCGAAAMEKYKDLKPDLVIMDIRLPDINGVEAIRFIKNYDTDSKIIVCSVEGHQNTVMDAIKAGACDFVTKPFDSERLLAALKKAVG